MGGLIALAAADRPWKNYQIECRYWRNGLRLSCQRPLLEVRGVTFDRA
jgi:hypothetical protein